MHRLFKVTALKGWRGKVHEHPVTKGTVGQIKEPIIHRSKNSISEMVKNSIIFGSIEAELWLASGHSPVKTRHYLTGLARIIWGLGIKKKAWRDGQVGMILMIYQVIHQWMVLTMLWEKQSRLGRK
jgi:hypothetical protein